MRSFSVAVLMAIGILFCAPSIMVAQEPNLRIFGLSYGSGVRTSDTRTELTGTFSEDGRYARFSLTVSVRNYGSKPARYKLQVQLERGGPSPVLEGFEGTASSVLGSFDVGPGAVSRQQHDFEIDFRRPGGAAGVALPPSPASAELVLLDQAGRALDRKPFKLVITPSTPRAAKALIYAFRTCNLFTRRRESDPDCARRDA
jgi:hypothetical protein